VVNESEFRPEDYGYAMESIVLYATASGLGTCWLGGSFKRSRFGKKAEIIKGETIPAVASVGYAADKNTLTDSLIRAGAGSKKREEAGELFFDSAMNSIDIDYEKGYGKALEMVRIAPSASNKQPWRIVKENDKNMYHFFIERTASYTLTIRLLRFADLQRIDMGIAMFHFESTAIEAGFKGRWKYEKPAGINTPAAWEYSITWDGSDI